MTNHILIVDDDVLTLESFEKSLPARIRSLAVTQSDGLDFPDVQITGADTLDSALAALKEKAFDVLVVDLKMSGSSEYDFGGFDIISESLKLDPFRPIIAVTGYGSIEVVRRTFRQGVFDFIEKSVEAGEQLANSVLNALSHRREQLVRAGNPFTPASGVSPTILCGRSKEIAYLEQRIVRTLGRGVPEHFQISGDWGTGKTALLREFKKICQSRGYVAVVVPIEPPETAATSTTVVKGLIQGILRSLPYPVDRMKRLLAFFQSVGIKVWNIEFELKTKDEKDELSPMVFLHDALQSMWEDLKDKSPALILLLDDVENLSSHLQVLTILQQTLAMESMQKKPILVGTAFSTRFRGGDNPNASTAPFSRAFNFQFELAALGKEESAEVIKRLLQQTGVAFSEEVVARIHEFTQGHPFELQVICHHLFENQMSRRVGIEVWDSAMQSALRDLAKAGFHDTSLRLSQGELAVLILLSSGKDGVAESEGLRAGTADYESTNLPPGVLRDLQLKGLIKRNASGMCVVCDRFFAEYLSQKFGFLGLPEVIRTPE